MSTDSRSAARGVAALKWVYVGVGLVLALVPIIWMLAGSFRTEQDLFGHPASLIPHQWTLHGYKGVWEQLPFSRLFLNSVVFAGITTALTLLFDSMCAYALARLNFRGRTVAFWLVLVTLMVPFQVTLIPVFVELFHFGWLNTYQGLIVPRATSAFGIFLFRQFFMSIPRELDEAARIDGAGHFRIYWRAQFHQSLERPALAPGGQQLAGYADAAGRPRSVRRPARHRSRRAAGGRRHLPPTDRGRFLPCPALFRCRHLDQRPEMSPHRAIS